MITLVDMLFWVGVSTVVGVVAVAANNASVSIFVGKHRDRPANK